jgi:RND family efflux transporter MFP subunit
MTIFHSKYRDEHRSEAGIARFPIILFLIVIVLAGLFFVGYLPRTARARQLVTASEASQREATEVSAAKVKAAPANAEILLSGNIQAVTEAGLYARTDGYVTKRIADIGDRVKAGQVLAELESPEVDQQLSQARATVLQSRSALAQTEAALQQAKANLSLAQNTLRRWKELVQQGVVSKQDGDEKESTYEARKADVAAAEANVKAAQNAITAGEANVQRLTEIQSFQQVRAPYDGVITTRNIVLGTLVSAGSSTAIRELYRITQLDPLKVMVNVPQSEVPSIHVGLECVLQVKELGGQTFNARVTRTANALDAASRTLLTEIQFANPSGQVLPGMYGEVRFTAHRNSPPLLLSSEAILTGRDGTRVALIRKNGTVHYQKIELGRDNGADTEITGGLALGDTVIMNPTDEIREGSRVIAVE